MWRQGGVIIICGILFLSLHYSTGLQQCSVTKTKYGPKEGRILTFFGEDVEINWPCRFKMANIQCGGKQFVIYGENSIDSSEKALPYVTGLVVNIATPQGDGSTMYQTLTLTSEKLKKYQKRRNFKGSPWTHTGSNIEKSQKIVGSYDEKKHLAVISDDKLQIEFKYVGSELYGNWRDYKLNIKCDDDSFRAIQEYPQTICGSGNNTEADMEAIETELKTDPDHSAYWFRNDYVMFAKQDVQQTNPQCQEASRIMSGTCENLGDKIYECHTMVDRTRTSRDYKRCVKRTGADSFKMYVTCLRVLCGTEGATPSDDTCQTLQQVGEECGDYMAVPHMSIRTLLERDKCPISPNLRTSAPAKSKAPDGRCIVRDKTSFFGRTVPGRTKGFVRVAEGGYGENLAVQLPCRYNMADIYCGNDRTIVTAQYSLDVTGMVYISKVWVRIISRRSKSTTKVIQTIKLTNKELKNYIEKGDFEAPLWRWTSSGSAEPTTEERVLDQYDPITQAGTLLHGRLNVTYRYINPEISNRIAGNMLLIQCLDTDFKGVERFPKTVCGGPEDMYDVPIRVKEETHPDQHHDMFPVDIFVLANQNRVQKDPLCQEAAEIVLSGNCSDMGNKLFKCNLVQNKYRSCAQHHEIDIFEAYVTCLRVLCGTDDANPSDDTCTTLRDLADNCTEVWDDHKVIPTLLDRSKC